MQTMVQLRLVLALVRDRIAAMVAAIVRHAAPLLYITPPTHTHTLYHTKHHTIMQSGAILALVRDRIAVMVAGTSYL